MGDVELFHQLFGAVFALFAGEVGANLQHRHQVVVHAQAAEDRRFLRQVTDAAARAACSGSRLMSSSSITMRPASRGTMPTTM